MNKYNQTGIAHIVVILVLAIGLIALVALVQREHIFKTEATNSEICEALEFKDENGTILECNASTNPPTVNTTSLNVSVIVKNKEALKSSE